MIFSFKAVHHPSCSFRSWFIPLLVSVLLTSGTSWAGGKAEYKDIYLTEGRVCKSCTALQINNHQVALANRKGERAIVEGREIVGIDEHPIVRRLFLKSLHGTGLAAKVIVPYAFDDAKDFVCKYCDP